ncbi:MAG: hypothetical protein ACK5MV_00195 [Aminipila sp.]
MTQREGIMKEIRNGMDNPYEIAEKLKISAGYVHRVMQGFKQKAKSNIIDNRFDLKVGDIVKADDFYLGKGCKFEVVAIYDDIFDCRKISGKYPIKTAFSKADYLCGDVRKVGRK